MHGVSEGNTENLGVLFDRHHARVHALCYRLTRGSDTADDLAQETFLRVLRYSRSYREDAAFTTWLYRIAYNLCAEQWRENRRDEPMSNDEVIRDGHDTELSDRHVLLDEAMRRLEPEQRAVLVLTRYHDLKYDDVARVLECTPAAARVRAHRALNDLKEIYRELEQRWHDVRTGPRGDRR
jgi:RNA polymerase sigma factor (sigma-70 family)